MSLRCFSRAVIYSLDAARGTATLDWQFEVGVDPSSAQLNTGTADAEQQGKTLEALGERVAPDDLLPSFSSRQLVTLTWAFARARTRPVRARTLAGRAA